ncbi:MAG: YXWGXW repeat-containing protein [Planctomycetota bacterium]
MSRQDRHHSRWPGMLMLLLACALSSTLWAQDDLGLDNEVEIMGRGPIHEAFAAPVVFDPEPGLFVYSPPPESIEEMPPDERPEGNFVWIGGYWSWDDEDGDYLWVSGIWRDVPPGRQWVPGYWRQSPKGYQWISGYWMATASNVVEYLPLPPASIEVGPSSEPPTPGHTWIPGCWVWHETRYVWRPGYWIVYQPDWVWVPASYVWTPGGCLFVDGYWDYAPVRRGVLFAPVRMSRVVYSQPAFVYSPHVVIDVDLAVGHFFARPRVRHYYFGDYYAREYVAAGIYPSFAFHYSRYGYDPIYAREVIVHRAVDPGWDLSIRADFFQRREKVELRPVRTYVTRRTAVGQPVIQSHTVISLAKPLNVYSSRSGSKFVRLDAGQREKAHSTSRALRDYTRQRAQREVVSSDPRLKQGSEQRSRRVEMPRSPLEREARQSETIRRSPPRPEPPAATSPKTQTSPDRRRPEPTEKMRSKTSSRGKRP